jgi:hypothetical protein
MLGISDYIYCVVCWVLFHVIAILEKPSMSDNPQTTKYPPFVSWDKHTASTLGEEINYWMSHPYEQGAKKYLEICHRMLKEKDHTYVY